MSLIPPAANNACVMVDKELSVYGPGLKASPNTKTRIERNSAKLMTTSTPIMRFVICAFKNVLSSAKVNPATSNAPRFGIITCPSRLTGN